MEVLTRLVEHLVALVEHKSLNVAQGKLLVTDKSVQAPGSANNDVRVGVLVGKDFNVLLNRGTSVENGCLDVRKVFAETSVLVLDLVGELTSMAHDEDRALARYGLKLVESREHEHGGLSKTRLGLAENIDVQNRGRDTNLLDCMWRQEDVRAGSNLQGIVAGASRERPSIPSVQYRAIRVR